jgi:hypothetical protein
VITRALHHRKSCKEIQELIKLSQNAKTKGELVARAVANLWIIKDEKNKRKYYLPNQEGDRLWVCKRFWMYSNKINETLLDKIWKDCYVTKL